MWTYPPRSVLVAVDFGDASLRALHIARALREHLGVPVTALHAEALEVPPYFTHDQLHDVERQRAATRQTAVRYLRRFVEGVVPGAASLLVDGQAVPTILAEATRHDLVVMGTHGRQGPSRWWAGSVAERVVRQAVVPVLVVRAEDTPTDPAAIFVRPAIVADQPCEEAASRLVEGLTATFGGARATRPAPSHSGLLCSPDATLMVVGVNPHDEAGWFGDATERLVRGCPLPMLFVPTPG
jgi:nucleotide-binding universal stress UspA family protein